MLTRLVQGLATCYPWSVANNEKIDQSLQFLESNLTTAEVTKAGYVTALIICGLLPAIILVPAQLRLVAGSSVMAMATISAYAIPRIPVITATLRRTAALGAAPSLISRAVLRMRIDPSEEAAVSFAADAGDDPLSNSLRQHVRRAAGTSGSGLDTFAAEWDEWFPALGRATQLLGTASSAPPAQRERALDRALTAVLEGTSERLRSFIAAVSGPATGIYAFGVLLPLALIAVLPGARAAGVAITLPVIIAIYDILLPVGLCLAAGWLLLKRPVAFPPPRVSRTHPAVPTSRWRALAAGSAGGIAAGVITGLVVGYWAMPVASIGWGVGLCLLVWYRPITAVRDRVQAIEAGLPDALYLIGRRVNDGQSVEQAIATTAQELSGETGALLADAARRQRVLAIDTKAALLGDQGALSTVPSRRAANLASLLSIAGEEGRPAGHAIVAMADHLDELQSVEREARHELARVTGTLSNTAAVFGPLVAGATVALADGMSTLGESTEVSTIAVSDLGIAVGSYVLLLAIILMTLSTALKQGLDRPTIGYRVGGTLVSATTIFVIAYLGAGMLI